MTTDIDALLAERAGYVARNLPDRVAQVDAEIARFGIAVAPAPKVEVETEVETAIEPPEVETADAPKKPRRPRKAN